MIGIAAFRQGRTPKALLPAISLALLTLGPTNAINGIENRLAAEDRVPVYTEHQDLTYYLDADGEKHRIQTEADWEIRRGHIKANIERVMGPLPQPEKPVPLDVEVLEEVGVGSLVRQKISYHTDSPDRRVSAYLFYPSKEALKQTGIPAMLCLHQTIQIGKEEPAGMGGNPNLHYALHLAERGYITLAPDYPSFGEYEYDFDPKHGYISGSMKAIYDNVRAIDLLQSLSAVDDERIGCIGHSLGGHNTMFTAFFDSRIRVAVSNCGFTRFHKYYGGKLAGWTSLRYMPLIAGEYDNNPDQVPFDFTEIVAGFAPRPFLASSPTMDSNFEVSGVKDAIKVAKPIYELYGVAENLQANYPECQHDFPEDVRKTAYEFIDRHLMK
ncbi:MAG: prolyl oligopeptidase family serine peptidase [Planctomycetaceae bacterium]